VKTQIPNRKSKIVIAGAGPAGASLAIRLARLDFDVTLIERETFPRHKLCGEFISPECLSHFEDLGVAEEMLRAGGERITETRFYAPGGHSFGISSSAFHGKGFALSLSRAEMDMRLLGRAKTSGAVVYEDTSVNGALMDKDKMIGLTARRGNGEKLEIAADLFIDATGRSRVISKLTAKGEYGRNEKASSRKSLFVGFKTHLKGAAPAKNTCEIYSFPGGYGGLSPVEIGLTNYCFLIRSAAVRKFGGNADEILKNVMLVNKRAADTLKDAEPVREWLAVSIDSFGRTQPNRIENLFSIGDSAAFIDPFTGSGMLMAFESAAFLAEVIESNPFSPDGIKADYLRKYRQRFTRRLHICSVLRNVAFVPYLPTLVISLLNLSTRGRDLLAASTRSTGNDHQKYAK
jgi:menaquinone-9 beta-reductase